MPASTHVLTDASITIGGTDLSDHVQSITLNYEAEAKDDTAMGDDTRSNAGGLKNWNADVTFHQNYASGEVDATLFPIVGSTTQLVIKPSSGVVAATNPSFTGTALLQSYAPIGGSVGDQHMTQAKFAPAGTLARATS